MISGAKGGSARSSMRRRQLAPWEERSRHAPRLEHAVQAKHPEARQPLKQRVRVIRRPLQLLKVLRSPRSERCGLAEAALVPECAGGDEESVAVACGACSVCARGGEGTRLVIWSCWNSQSKGAQVQAQTIVSAQASAAASAPATP